MSGFTDQKIMKDCNHHHVGSRIVFQAHIFCVKCDGWHKKWVYQNDYGKYIQVNEADYFIAEEKDRMAEIERMK